VTGDVRLIMGFSFNPGIGVKATNGAGVTVEGSVRVSRGIGVYADSGGVVKVMGDVIAITGVHAVHAGAAVYIHGEINASGDYINFVNDSGVNIPVAKLPYPGQETIGGVAFYRYSSSGVFLAGPSNVYVKFKDPGALSGMVSIDLNNSNGLLTANTSAVTGGSGAFTYTWEGDGVTDSKTSTLALGTGYTLGQAVKLTLTRADVTGRLTEKIEVYQVSGTTQANATTGTFSIPASYRETGELVPCTYSAGNSTGVTFKGGDGFVPKLTEDYTGYVVDARDAMDRGVIQIIAFFEGPSTTILYGDVDGNGEVETWDVFVLHRYLAKWTEYPVEVVNWEAADVNLDGDVDAIDVSILHRYLAMWADFPKLPHVAGSGQGFQTMTGARESIFGPPVLQVGNAEGKAGETVRVPISIERNPGITGMLFAVSYDETALRLVGYENTGLLPGAAHNTASVLASATFAWFNALAITNNTNNGVLVYLEFEILEGTKPGVSAIELTYKPNNIVNAGLSSVHFDTEPGSVAVNAAPVITAATANFVSIVETAKNSGVWALSLTVTETWSDGGRRTVPYTIEIKANNANVSGRYDFGRGWLAEPGDVQTNDK
jgi:hypothetical protein